MQDDGLRGAPSTGEGRGCQLGINGTTDDPEQRDRDLDDDDPCEHTEHGLLRRRRISRRKELLVHPALTEDKQKRRHRDAHHPQQVVSTHDRHMGGRECRRDGIDPTIGEDHVWQREQYAERDDDAVEDVHRDDRDHSGQGGEEYDCHACDQHAEFRGDRSVRHDREDPATTPKLVGGDRHVGQDDRNRAEYPRSGVVALLEQIGNRVLGDAADAWGKVETQDHSKPAAGGEPQLRDPRVVGQPCPAEQ